MQVITIPKDRDKTDKIGVDFPKELPLKRKMKRSPKVEIINMVPPEEEIIEMIPRKGTNQ